MSAKRVKKDNLVIAPCSNACPVGINVPRYLRCIKEGDFDESLAVIREKIPFPTVCADACFNPCEDSCAYKQFGDPIAIRALKRAAADKGNGHWKKNKKVATRTEKKIAIIGAGPSGLTAAYYLVSLGHSVTVYDTFPKPGGTMRYGIPQYRLPEERLDKDVNDILGWGVTFKGNTTIGKDITLDQLKLEYNTILITSGTNRSLKISLEGMEKKNVLWGLDFLRDFKLGKPFDLKGDVIVVGGGNVAIDVALTAKRLGAAKVNLFCLEKREEMPAHEWEIARAEEEGILIHNSWAPKKILGEESVKGLNVVKCLSVFDPAGKFNPTYDEETTSWFEANYLILAIGQTSDLEFLKNEKNIQLDRGRVGVKETNLATGADGIFAGGDVVSGPSSIINAIAHGRKAAAAIDLYLGGSGNIDEVLAKPEEEIFLQEFKMDIKLRNDMTILKPWERISCFDQVELGLKEDQIREEAGRCLNCDARKFEVVLTTQYCKECGYCVEVCKMGTFGPANFFNDKGYRPEEVKSSDWCVGCLKCYFSCPDFAIDVVEVTG